MNTSKGSEEWARGVGPEEWGWWSWWGWWGQLNKTRDKLEDWDSVKTVATSVVCDFGPVQFQATETSLVNCKKILTKNQSRTIMNPCNFLISWITNLNNTQEQETRVNQVQEVIITQAM